MSMCMGAAIGTGVVVSQYFGAKDKKGTASSIANGSYTCILIAFVMTAIALLTTKPILLLLNTPQSLLPDALTYMYIFMGGLIAVAAYFTPFSILRALGDSKTPLTFLVLFGESVIGAFTATTQIELLVQQIFSALGSAIVTYTGQNIGAGKHDRIHQGVTASMKISAVVSAILLAVFWIFCKPIMSIFVTNNEIISIATMGIRITSLFLMALGGVQILRYMYNGAGDSMYALMNGIVEVVARVALAISLTAFPFIGMWGIWLTTGLTWTVTAIFALFRYKHGA